jgi:hypothetical protein
VSSAISSAVSSAASSSSSVSPGDDFFVFDIRSMNEILLRGSVNTGGGVEDVQIGKNGLVFVASPRASQSMTTVNVQNPSAPVVAQRYSAGQWPGLAVDTSNTLSVLGLEQLIPAPSDGSLTLWPGVDGTPNGTNLRLLTRAPVSRLRLDPSGCYAFMSLGTSGSGKELSIAKVSNPASPTVAQTYDDGVGTKGTSVLYNPWVDRIYLLSNYAFTILGPQVPGTGGCP